jgi:hypothetical protein
MNNKGIPCDKCITKPMCLNRIKIKCGFLTDFMLKNFDDYYTHMSATSMYHFELGNTSVAIDGVNKIITSVSFILSSECGFTKTRRMSLVHLYKVMKEIMNLRKNRKVN